MRKKLLILILMGLFMLSFAQAVDWKLVWEAYKAL